MVGVGVSSELVAPGGRQTWSVETQVSLDRSVPALLGKHGGPLGACAAQRGPEEKYARMKGPGPCPSCVSLPTHAGWLGLSPLSSLTPGLRG